MYSHCEVWRNNMKITAPEEDPLKEIIDERIAQNYINERPGLRRKITTYHEVDEDGEEYTISIESGYE